MEKFSTEYFLKLAHDLKFDLSEQEIEELKKDFEQVEAQVASFETIDTEGVEPMVYPFETPTVFMREDEVDEVLSQKEALSNVNDVRMGHVHVPKVVK
jgi:aspartyl-tRNA(Asn)/glutamyl-tRNA(Gln) amidotransferase subunit C